MTSPNIQRAQLLYQQQRYDMAAESCRAALAEMPTEPYVHALLGLCLLHLQKYEEATAEAQQAIVLAPDFAFGHYALAGVYMERHRYPESEAAAREAVRLEADNADFWGLLAQAIFNGQRWKEALEAANTGLQYDGEHTLCVNIRAMALVKLGDKQGAAASIQEALRRNPHNSLNHANQGWTMLHQGNHKQALEHFREALRLEPDNEWARQGMMQALKARYFLYRVMLRYYLWMSRFTSKAQWGIIIGLWVGIQILDMVKNKNPGLAPFIFPILVVYVLFVFAGWVADPIFNLSLLINRFGRHLLTLTQKAGAILTGALLPVALVGLVVGWFLPSDLLLLVGIITGLLILPVAATVRCRERGHLILMSCYTIVLAFVGPISLVLEMAGIQAGMNGFTLFVWGCVLSGFASNILGTMVPKR